MKEDRIAQFKEHMKEEFAKIPKNLTIEECLDRADRCSALSETFRQEGDMFKAKKYQLLSLKYKQIADEKKNPRPKEVPGVPVQVIIDETPAQVEVKKESLFKRIVKWFSEEEKKESTSN